MGQVQVKFCGLRNLQDVEVAANVGASYAGFVFFEKSPRHLILDQALNLMLAAPLGLAKVALVVDPDDATLDAMTARLPIDILQLHGHESPARVAEIRARTGLPIMKAIGVADADDLAQILDYSVVSDQILIDAKPTNDAALPGGNGLSFDWRLLVQLHWIKPWMLAGGLTSQNVAQAAALTKARQVDVSSGVESCVGLKDPIQMLDFVTALKDS
ncbi:MAG: phosphoribosylanthranilate isomerase [Paracoccaceae bacterium]|jgi:phosphoribosylanthranilate isomerase